MKSISNLAQYFFKGLKNKLTRPQYVTLIAIFTGLLSGITAVLLKTLVHLLQKWFIYGQWYYLLLPAAGLLVTISITQWLFKGSFERGIAMVLRSIAKKSSYIPTSNTYKHIVTSAFTVGMGGSAGLEAPIVANGSSWGSLLGRITDLNYQERTLMLACGAAAGIAAVFNAPIAGVIFAVEVLLAETVVSYFIPLMIASVTGVLCSKIILNESNLFNFVLQQTFDYRNVPYYILLGLIAGFVSLYYAGIFKRVEKKLVHSKINIYTKAALGGLLLAFLIYFLPPLFGEGYRSVTHLANASISSVTVNPLFNTLNNNLLTISFLGLVLLIKPIAVAITLGSGGNGGNFAPSLFTGSFLGFFFAKIINSTGAGKIPEGNFTLVAMAGVLSGVMYCPLTAIFLIAEITNGYGLFIPLMIVSAISFFIVKQFEPYSMDTKKLAEEGEMFTHKKEKNILTSITLQSILSDEYPQLKTTDSIHNLLETIKKSEKNIFAVIDEKEKFSGIIEVNDIKPLLFDETRRAGATIKSLTKKPRDVIYENEAMTSVMGKLDSSQSWYLPVITREKKFISFISKTKLFNRYREILAEQKDIYETN